MKEELLDPLLARRRRLVLRVSVVIYFLSIHFFRGVRFFFWALPFSHVNRVVVLLTH